MDNADITGDMECFEMEPMNELKVGQDVQLRCIVKSCDLEEASIWYAQVNNILFLLHYQMQKAVMLTRTQSLKPRT